MVKAIHLAVDLHHSESPPCGHSAVEWLMELELLERACESRSAVNIRREFEKCKPREPAA